MKSKLTLILLLLSAFIFQASAHLTIIVSGGGATRQFRYVHANRNTIVCLGNGPLNCPAGWSNAVWSGVPHPVQDVVDYIFKLVDTGNNTGSVNYKNDLPVTWKVLDDKNVQIDIEEKNTTGLEKYGNN